MRHCGQCRVDIHLAQGFDRGDIGEHDEAIQRFKKQHDTQENRDDPQLSIFLLLVYKFILTFIFMSELVKHVMMIIFIAASCPVGMNVANFAVIYNKDESYASLLVSASSLICVISLPLIVKLAEIVL